MTGRRIAEDCTLDSIMAIETVLLDDVKRAFNERESPHMRRSAIRAVFAAVEGFLWSLKESLLKNGGFKLTASELALLREEQYQVSGNGSAETKKLLIRLRDNIRFTMHIAQRLHPEHAVDYTASGWQALVESTKVRDRLMHPKSETDLDVSTDELLQAMEGFTWFAGITAAGHKALSSFLETPEAQTHQLVRVLRESAAKNIGKGLISMAMDETSTPLPLRSAGTADAGD